MDPDAVAEFANGEGPDNIIGLPYGADPDTYVPPDLQTAMSLLPPDDDDELPADDPREPFIPRARFDEVNQQLAALREQAGSLDPWRPIVDTLTQGGLTPDQVAQQLQAARAPQAQQPAYQPDYQPAPDPEAQFHDWLQQNVPNADQLDDTGYALAYRQFSQDSRLAQMEEMLGYYQQQAAQAHQQAQLQQVQSQFPELANPVLSQAVAAMAQTTGVPLQQAAQQLAAALQLGQRNAAAQAVVQPAPARPSPAPGGAPPAPTEDRSWVETASPEDFHSKMRKIIRGALR